VKTRLVSALGAEGAAGLYRAFLLDAAALAREVRDARPSVELAAEWAPEEDEALSSLPLSGWLPGPFRHRAQAGGDLGERMAGALERALAEGGAAVLIGSDFPDLPARVLLTAFERLTSPARPDRPLRAAIGPAGDGGYYLIGLTAPARAIFEEIAWGTEGVFGATLEKLRGLGAEVAVLDRWEDVDSPADLETLRRRLAARPESVAPHTRAWLRRA
jgi:hypothetical protein